MADHSSRPPSSPGSSPDYDLDDYLGLDTEQTRLLIEPTRMAIVDLLNERAATVSQLADALDKPKGTVGHHAKVLEEAGLIHVVRTEQVRAIRAKYYGRTARTFLLPSMTDVGVGKDFMFAEAAREMAAGLEAGLDQTMEPMTAVRYARIPVERAEEWGRRFAELMIEFTTQERGGTTVFGATFAIFPTTRRGLETT